MAATRHRKTTASRRRSPVQARARETVRAILEAAAQVFERRGYAATTDQIAERAGVSVGSLYQYFPNKEALLVALAEGHLLEAMGRLRPLVERVRTGAPDPHEVVRAFVRASIESNGRWPRLHRILHEQPAVRRAIGRSAGPGMRDVVDALADYLAGRSEVKVRDPALAAVLLTESLMGLVHEFALDPPAGFDIADCEAELVSLFCGYLTGTP